LHKLQQITVYITISRWLYTFVGVIAKLHCIRLVEMCQTDGRQTFAAELYCIQ